MFKLGGLGLDEGVETQQDFPISRIHCVWRQFGTWSAAGSGLLHLCCMPGRCFEVGNDDGAGAVLFNQIHSADDGDGNTRQGEAECLLDGQDGKIIIGQFVIPCRQADLSHTSTGI